MRVLVVDDSEDVRHLLEDVVDQAGHTPVLVGNGREARELLDQGGKFGHIVSDNDMPEMTGVELLEWVRGNSQTAGIPFILISAGDPVPLKEICAKHSADFLPKPFSIFALLALLDVGVEITT